MRYRRTLAGATITETASQPQDESLHPQVVAAPGLYGMAGASALTWIAF